jgi:hypothetical protein
MYPAKNLLEKENVFDENTYLNIFPCGINLLPDRI